MDWMRLGEWVDKGQAPDDGKIARWNIGTVFVNPTDSNARTYINDLFRKGIQAGIYEATSWYPGVDPATFAGLVSADIGRLIPQAGVHPVMLDLEAIAPAWVSSFLKYYRHSRPVRETAYTNEPFKDGTVVPIPDLLAANIHWYIQLYRGDMTPVEKACAMMEIARGYPPNMVHPFYDGKDPTLGDVLLLKSDGCIFTQQRLP